MKKRKNDCRSVEERCAKQVNWAANIAIVFALIALIMGAGVMALAFQNNQNVLSLESMYQKSLHDVYDDMSSIETNLSKLMVSNDSYQTSLLANEVWRQSDNASSNLAQLPLDHHSLANTTKFVNQLGDYSYSISKRLGRGAQLNDKETDQLEDLYYACRTINAELTDLITMINSDNYKIIDHVDNGVARRKLQLRREVPFSKSFDTLEQHSVDYPKMIYDGPFSDSVEDREFAALKGLEEVTPEQAAERIAAIFDDVYEGNIEYRGEAGGDLVTYEFDINGQDGMYIQMTKQGCLPVMVSTNRDVKSAKMGREEATRIAEEFATKAGFESMNGVWYNEISNIAYINMVKVQGDVSIYPDMIKVKVALDNGQIMGLESMSYCCSHKERSADMFTPTISVNTAKSMVSSRLKINNSRLVIIPKDDSEVLAYEFECERNNLDYFVYIDAFDGHQTDIQRVVDEYQGKMMQ